MIEVPPMHYCKIMNPIAMTEEDGLVYLSGGV
jgi:hypothetical protein